MNTPGGLSDRRGKDERGFALLLVFVLAAAIAISFYMALPRAIFEAQRRKEQLLVDRGQEYVTAIRHYYRKFQRFPAKIDDLENTNNMRFLRKRYVDPMTGKDDWRLIHAGPGGMLLDSLVQKPGGLPGAPGQNPNQPGIQGQGSSGIQTSSSNGMPSTPVQSASSPSSTDSTGVQVAADPNPGLVRRPSDHFPGSPAQHGVSDPNADPFGNPSSNPGNETSGSVIDPGQAPPASFGDQPSGLPGYPGQGDPEHASSNAAFPPQSIPGQANPGQPGAPGVPGFPQQPGQSQSPFGGNQPVTPGAPAFPPGGASFQSGAYQQPGMPGAPAAPFNPALQQIQNQLTSPNSNSNSPFGTNNSPFGGGQTVGGGIVGVASKLPQKGIKEFDKHRKYSEWEFIFDMKKLNGLPGQAPQLQNIPGMNPNGQNSSNTPFSQSNQQPSTAPPATSPPPSSFPGTPQMPPTTISPPGPNN